jgi:hypothetical protein
LRFCFHPCTSGGTPLSLTFGGPEVTVKSLAQYEVVRVRQLLHGPGHYNGWKLNKRPPAVGDEGTIVEILKAEGLQDCFVVECSDECGRTIWLGDFSSEEIEIAEPAAPPNGGPAARSGNLDVSDGPPSAS